MLLRVVLIKTAVVHYIHRFFPYMTMHGIGMQQHSKPSHSIHFLGAEAPSQGLTIDETVEIAAEPGLLAVNVGGDAEIPIVLVMSKISYFPSQE